MGLLSNGVIKMIKNDVELQEALQFVKAQLNNPAFNLVQIGLATRISRRTLDNISKGKKCNPSIIAVLHTYFKNLTK